MTDPGPTLIQSAPYISRFQGQYVVVKLGGELLDGPAAPAADRGHRPTVLERLVDQITVLAQTGLRPVLVHGGGKQIDLECERRGITVQKRGGRRITGADVLDVVLDVVARDLNLRLCRRLQAAGLATRGYADGVSAGLRCQRRPPAEIDGEQIDFGEVGDVIRVDANAIVGEGGAAVPVLPCVGTLEAGAQVNVNADSVAAQAAIALGAQKLVLLSNLPGVMHSLDDAGPIAQLSPQRARELIDGGQAHAGMRAKLEEALRALAGGVAQVHVVSGIEPQTLLREIYTEEGCGTLISAHLG